MVSLSQPATMDAVCSTDDMDNGTCMLMSCLSNYLTKVFHLLIFFSTAHESWHNNVNHSAC